MGVKNYRMCVVAKVATAFELANTYFGVKKKVALNEYKNIEKKIGLNIGLLCTCVFCN